MTATVNTYVVSGHATTSGKSTRGAKRGARFKRWTTGQALGVLGVDTRSEVVFVLSVPTPMDNREFYYRAKLALQEWWWQGKEPDGPPVRRELSAVKQWRKSVGDDELLIEALESYRGSPLAFLYGHKRGNNHIMNRLLAKARRQRRDSQSLGEILRDAYDSAGERK